MRQPFLRHWDAKGSAPALILHATDVDYGYRVVISPFKITEAPDEYLALRDFHDTFMRERTAAEKAQGVGEDKVTDIALSTAIGVSARYPWFMPPASFAREGTRRRNRLLDGGIFENSGVETVHDIIQELQELEKPPKERPEALQGLPWVQFHVVIISGYQLNRPTDGPGSRGSHETAYPKGSMGGEALAPITSMLGTRVQRANMASYRLFRERGYDCAIAGQAERCREAGVRFLVLNHQDFRLPLGWQLSPYTRRVVETHIGQPQECNPVDRVRTMFTGIESEERQRYTVRENNCTTCAVLTAMRGEKFQGSTLCKP